MIRRILCLLLVGSIVVACGAPSDVSIDDTKSKEKQIDDATNKLTGGETRDQGQ